MPEILITKDLSYGYQGQPALHFPDIRVEEGSEMLITGESGKGKTTLLHLLGGLLRPQAGTVVISGQDLGAMPDGKRDRFRGEKIGMILQEAHFVRSISTLENICLASWLATGNRHEDRAREILSGLGLTGHMHKLPSRLSVGQQQRASIARAVVNRPAILLADEPTSSLDDANAMAVAQLLRKTSAQAGTALIIVTHDKRLKNEFKNQVAL